MKKYIENDYKVSDSYLQSHEEYFRLYDTNNCGRVYEAVKHV